MPAARQGDIHWYDFGPDIGAELSGHRPALVISNNEFNGRYGVAITVPTSTTMPRGEFSRQHVLIAASNSWASAWHVKTVDEDKLGDFIGQASPDELEDVVEALGLRLDQRHAPGQITTRRGAFPIEAGTMWRLSLADPVRGEFQTTVLVLDYNAGNKMAITVSVAPGAPSAGSPVAVPIAIPGSGQVVSARVHVVRSIDASERDLAPAGEIGPEDVDAVIDRLQTLL